VVGTLRARHEADGLRLDAHTAKPGWFGERLDVGWAIDVLHPRATGEMSPRARLPGLEGDVELDRGDGDDVRGGAEAG
jgi:hypothetical protein